MLTLADHRASDEVALLIVPDHGGAANAAKGAERGHEINRFEDVRLALGVFAQQQMKPRRKSRVHPRIIAEVPESQTSQMHPQSMKCRRRVGQIFCCASWHCHPVHGNSDLEFRLQAAFK